MSKVLKVLIPTIVLLGVVTLVATSSRAFSKPDNPEFTALNDYKTGEKSLNNKITYGASENNFVLSEFSIPVYSIVQADKILNYNGESISGILENEKQNLWFMMNQDSPEGIVVANSVKPIKMGGKNRSKDLLNIYKTIKKDLGSKDSIKYFEFEGQGIFVVNSNNKEEVYLSESASKILGLPRNKKLSPYEVIKKVKEHVLNSNNNFIG